jgi:Mrp family chromosome partitioning ATPase
MKSMPFSMPIIPGVQRSIAVASGKGGVGKSTTAVQLALAFQRQGLKVGLLDADIYGPSLPTLLGDHSKPGTTSDKKIIPLQSFGISWMSIGLMIPEEAPLIWRGPMIAHQGAQKEAERLNVPFLGAIPLNATLRMVCDAGTPHKLEQTDILALFDEIVRKVQIRLSQDKKKENF